MSDTIYALIKTNESAPVFDDAVDDDVAAEAIYLDHLNAKLMDHGITVVEIELLDRPTGCLAESIRGHLSPTTGDDHWVTFKLPRNVWEHWSECCPGDPDDEIRDHVIDVYRQGQETAER